MPIHEYECNDCGAIFEILELAGREMPAECPSCGGEKARKLFSRFSSPASTSCEMPCCEMPDCSSGRCCGPMGCDI